MIHWHNIYWLIKNGKKLQSVYDKYGKADIVEIDAIYYKGDVMCSHSWRPWKWLMYGKADYYFEAFKKYKGNKKVYFYIELKTGEEKIIYKLVTLMHNNKNDNVTYIIGGKAKTKRETIANKIYWRTTVYCNVEWAKDFFKERKKEIERKELYKNKPWYKRLNYF